MYRLLTVLILAASLFAFGCSDDDNGSTHADGAVTQQDGAGFVDQAVTEDSTTADDTTPAADTAPAADTTPTADGAPGADASAGTNCMETSTCSDDCVANCGAFDFACKMACPETCKEQACDSAKPLFQAVMDCVTGNCMMQCAAGSSPDCDTCVQNNCGNELAACEAHSC